MVLKHLSTYQIDPYRLSTPDRIVLPYDNLGLCHEAVVGVKANIRRVARNEPRMLAFEVCLQTTSMITPFSICVYLLDDEPHLAPSVSTSKRIRVLVSLGLSQASRWPSCPSFYLLDCRL